MASRGFLIRFIDIGLIVLFGFVMLSDIDVLSQVEMSTGDESQQEEPPVERTVVTVAIASDGVFSLVDAESGTVISSAVSAVDTLEAMLRQIRDLSAARGRETVVLIQPDDNSIVQRTVDVMDLADRIGVGKSLQTARPEPR